MLNAMQFDWSVYPGISAWLARMKSLPFHDEVNEEAFQFVNNLYQTKLAETQAGPSSKTANGQAVKANKSGKQKKSSVCSIL